MLYMIVFVDVTDEGFKLLCHFYMTDTIMTGRTLTCDDHPQVDQEDLHVDVLYHLPVTVTRRRGATGSASNYSRRQVHGCYKYLDQ